MKVLVARKTPTPRDLKWTKPVFPFSSHILTAPELGGRLAPTFQSQSHLCPWAANVTFRKAGEATVQLGLSLAPAKCIPCVACLKDLWCLTLWVRLAASNQVLEFRVCATSDRCVSSLPQIPPPFNAEVYMKEHRSRANKGAGHMAIILLFY